LIFSLLATSSIKLNLNLNSAKKQNGSPLTQSHRSHTVTWCHVPTDSSSCGTSLSNISSDRRWKSTSALAS